MLETPPSVPITAYYYPDYRGTNPYQSLLYQALRPVAEALPLASLRQLSALPRTVGLAPVLHLHWETAAFIDAELSPDALLDTLSAFRDSGGRILWTVHNLEPHDARYRAAAAKIRTGLLALADIVHFHSLPALAAAREIWHLPLVKVRVIPHGNYDGAYPVYNKAAARQDLGLDAKGMVALMPGQIRAYKQPAALLQSFLAVAEAEDRLIVAGHQASDSRDLAFPDDPRIIAKTGFCTAEDLARLHAAADFIVLPYSQSLTSGSAILAATLRRGVLGSDTPGLRDAVMCPSAGVLADLGTPIAMQSALKQALGDGGEVWERRGTAAAAQARARDWTVIGAMWQSVFLDIARRPRQPKPAAADA